MYWTGFGKLLKQAIMLKILFCYWSKNLGKIMMKIKYIVLKRKEGGLKEFIQKNTHKNTMFCSVEWKGVK